jgi:phenylacetate-coenzyme A ligase PaaK-like adenylate-forming protein
VGRLLQTGLKRIGADPVPYGPVRDPLQVLEEIHSGQINCLVGSPTQVLGLARRWKPGMYRPRSVLLSTDYVPAAIIRTLENIWNCEVYNHYGATEMGLGGGVECAAHRGFHLREADLYVELINPLTGEAARDGEEGEIVFTTLTRRGMPLIRYRMGDRSRFIPGDCPCGTRLKTLEKVSGRYSGFVPVGDAVLRLPDFDEVLFPVPGLLNFSVTVTGERGKESLLIETKMLTEADAGELIEKALRKIPAVKNLDIRIACQYSPQEAGNLSKRVIIDKRGQDA